MLLWLGKVRVLLSEKKMNLNKREKGFERKHSDTVLGMKSWVKSERKGRTLILWMVIKIDGKWMGGRLNTQRIWYKSKQIRGKNSDEKWRKYVENEIKDPGKKKKCGKAKDVEIFWKMERVGIYGLLLMDFLVGIVVCGIVKKVWKLKLMKKDILKEDRCKGRIKKGYWYLKEIGVGQYTK